jgi:ketosteroid isomerase-like protein
VYQYIIRRVTRSMFERLGRGEWQAIVRDLAPDVHHVFAGEHPLGGERHSRRAVELWFERLGRLFPQHHFDVHRVISRGGPWNTWVAVQWTAHLHPQQGAPYLNEGAHWIHLRWGKVTYFHAYLDTDLIARACREMAELGVAEAASPPIAD